MALLGGPPSLVKQRLEANQVTEERDRGRMILAVAPGTVEGLELDL
jgi:hypothetical protein